MNDLTGSPRKLLAEILRYSELLEWVVEHSEVDSLNLAGVFLHNSVSVSTNISYTMVDLITIKIECCRETN